jgi:checkpoint serine/threonine-protein kinase
LAFAFCIQTKSNLDNENNPPHPLRELQQAVNPKTGRVEVVFVHLEKVYPNHKDPMSEEYSFEELRAKHRGLLHVDWAAIRREEREQAKAAAEASVAAAKVPKSKPVPLAPKHVEEQPPKPQTIPLKGSVDDENANDENTPPSQEDLDKARAAKKARREERANRTRKIKVMEVKEIQNETQTSKIYRKILSVES